MQKKPHRSIAFISFISLPLLVATMSASPPSSLEGRTIVVDAGHGVINYQGDVINSGKETSSGVQEFRLAFAISQKLGKTLQERGAHVVYTRTPFDFWRQNYSAAEDNKMRAFFANELKADAFLAIHCDWDPKSKVHGVTTIYEKPDSRLLGDTIQRTLIKKLRAYDRHLLFGQFTVLDHAEVPAVIIETGFLSNRRESKKIRSDDYQKKIAQAIADALETYFQS